MLRIVLTLLLLSLSWSPVRAQNPPLYTYQQLSGTYFAAQKDSLKKAWTCPTVSSDRGVQRKFREIWDERTSFLVAAIEKQHFLYEPELYQYLQAIIDQLIAANPQYFSARPFLLVDRSSVANAYALGSNVLVMNLGLIRFVGTREELALSIAHELSHNIQHHPENAMKETAEWLESAEYKNSLKAVLDSKYERYSRLKQVFQVYRFSRSRHQRYHESEADSLAVILMKNAHIPFRAAYFLRLDSADGQYQRPLQRPLNDYLRDYHLTASETWMQTRSRGLSTAQYDFADTAGIQDSLKTHPDCIDRYRRTLALSDSDAATTPIPAAVSVKATKMLIWNMFDDNSLTACLYSIWQEKDKGRADGWYDFMVYSIFAGLYYQDRDLHRFSAIDIKPKEYISKDYYRLQTMLARMPAEDLGQYCTTLRQATFWDQRPADEKALGKFLAALSTTGENPEKARRESAEEFIGSNAASMYCEFAEHFRKK
ncbi:MAG TPA: M48 family metalloprotease [Puia sp.]|jgi:Zn-dependent protease with chaperone function|nr:M48 family metalloprotease [Puia sp.]